MALWFGETFASHRRSWFFISHSLCFSLRHPFVIHPPFSILHPLSTLTDLPHHRPKPLYVPVTRNNESTFCTRDYYLAPRVAFITWLVTFFLEKKYISSAAAAQSAKNGTEVIPKLIQVSVRGTILLLMLWFRRKQNGPLSQCFWSKTLSTNHCVERNWDLLKTSSQMYQ